MYRRFEQRCFVKRVIEDLSEKRCFNGQNGTTKAVMHVNKIKQSNKQQNDCREIFYEVLYSSQRRTLDCTSF